MKHGLIFDLDGTLVDSLSGISASLNHALASSGMLIHDMAAVRGFIGNGARILVERGAPAGTDETSLSLLEQAFKSHYDLNWAGGTALYNGVTLLLEQLQNDGYSMGVLSNKPHAFTETIVARLFPSIRFSMVLGQRDGISHKPDPTGALEIALAFNLTPQDCSIIGDSTVDLATAKNAGMRAIAVTWGFHDRGPLLEAGADLVFDSPSQLAEYFA